MRKINQKPLIVYNAFFYSVKSMFGFSNCIFLSVLYLQGMELQDLATRKKKTLHLYATFWLVRHVKVKIHETLDMKPEDFRWIEVKTGYGKLGQKQFDTSKKIKILLFRCRVANALAPPEEVKVFWDKVNESCLRWLLYVTRITIT